MLKMLDLFSGIGGFSLAASWTGGIETVAFCEIEPFCQKVLKKHWPDVPIYPDIKQLKGEDIGSVDIVCGGFPCQPFSCAGKQRGKEDDRYLWPEMFRVIQETNPTWVIGENVTGLIDLALEDCFSDLEGQGYEVQPLIIPACAIGAPHRRDRVWIVAHSRERGLPFREKAEITGFGGSSEHVCNPSGKRFQNRRTIAMGRPQSFPESQRSDWWAAEPNVGRVANGIPHRVDRLKALGNAIVPQVVYPILQGIVDIENN